MNALPPEVISHYEGKGKETGVTGGKPKGQPCEQVSHTDSIPRQDLKGWASH